MQIHRTAEKITRLEVSLDVEEVEAILLDHVIARLRLPASAVASLTWGNQNPSLEVHLEIKEDIE